MGKCEWFLENRPSEAKQVIFVSQFACFPTTFVANPLHSCLFRLAYCDVSLFHSGLVECST